MRACSTTAGGQVSAVLSGPFEINEDVGVEPNGRELLLGAAMAAEFTGNKISAFRNNSP
jgi:hypothetical protein